MVINDLPFEEQVKLTKVAGACLVLKDRLEAHSFKIIKFRVFVSADQIGLHFILPEFISGISTHVRIDDTLPAGTIQVAALVH